MNSLSTDQQQAIDRVVFFLEAAHNYYLWDAPHLTGGPAVKYL